MQSENKFAYIVKKVYLCARKANAKKVLGGIFAGIGTLQLILSAITDIKEGKKKTL